MRETNLSNERNKRDGVLEIESSTAISIFTLRITFFVTYRTSAQVGQFGIQLTAPEYVDGFRGLNSDSFVK